MSFESTVVAGGLIGEREVKILNHLRLVQLVPRQPRATATTDKKNLRLGVIHYVLMDSGEREREIERC